ncbi:MAG: hypothetical protein HYY10_03625 [Candidatus Liptonbacteria bacterium]|nr:hypothetical protein [Candidatus Liptonbacteria bacterium]
MHELNTSDIEKQEAIVRRITHQRLGGFCTYLNKAIDVLIKLYYRLPKIKDVETLEDRYLSDLGYWLYMSTFTFRSCFLLIENGYYLEANIICRSLIEIYVKMRYFENRKDQLETFEQPHINSKKRPTVNFKTMFDEVLPGYYDEVYRFMLSHMAHGGVGARLFKVRFRSPTNMEADQGVVFNEEWGSMVINNLSSYIFGYIRFYKHIYPDTIKGLEPDVIKELLSVEKTLETNFNQHIQLKGKENAWHKVSRQIWDFK